MYVCEEPVPDGIKGKTWSYSTLQPRTRTNLPALDQAATDKPPHFSKSAPNLDKSRAAGNDSPPGASSSHNHFLGKSVDGLNMINSSNSNSNSTKLGSVDHLNNDGRYDRHHEQDDDDDDDRETPGCFSFMGRNDDTLMKRRKKHSLDSKMADTPRQNASVPVNALHIAVKSIGAAAYVHEVGVEDESYKQNLDLDKADYDRVFYRKMQKSLDDIADKAVFQTQCLPFEKEHFNRECFLVNNNDDNEDDSSFDAATSTNQEHSQKSFDSSFNDRNSNEYDEKFSSGELIYQNEQTNSSSDTASTSRKNSVTFRDDDGSAQYSLLSDASIESTPIAIPNTKVRHYAIISNPNVLNSTDSTNSKFTKSNVSQKSVVAKKERKEKTPYGWSIWQRNKKSPTELSEQLLSEPQI